MEVLIGSLIMLACLFKNKKLLRVQWNSVASFIAIMALVICIRLACINFLYKNLPGFQIPTVPLELQIMGIWNIALVFWEDAVFGMSIYWLMRFKKWIAWPLIIAISALFGYEHMYQGIVVAGILSLYPYLISYRYGSKYGFGTVMVCHTLYDFMTIYMIWLLPYLLM